MLQTHFLLNTLKLYVHLRKQNYINVSNLYQQPYQSWAKLDKNLKFVKREISIGKILYLQNTVTKLSL